MTERIIIAGSGGQGIMLLGKVLAQTAMRENKFITWLPAYGPEVRGGAAHCMVIISDSEIGSVYIDKADTLIMMNQPSLAKFKNRLKDNGLMVLNTSLAKEGPGNKTRLARGKFTDIAIELGNIKVANMVALGSYLANKKTLRVENIFSVMKEMAPPDQPGLLEVNQKALKKGMELAKNG